MTAKQRRAWERANVLMDGWNRDHGPCWDTEDVCPDKHWEAWMGFDALASTRHDVAASLALDGFDVKDLP